jgi:spermidine synthase
LKPWRTVGTAEVPGGLQLILREHDGEFVLWAGGYELMTSRVHGSEVALGKLGASGLRRGARVLIGGLGMGYTLRAALDVLPRDSYVAIAEISDAVVEWNRGPLAHLAGDPLSDRRVEVLLEDVRDSIAAGGWDAILIDVDNGPDAVLMDANDGLYTPPGVAAAFAALNPGGMLAIWSVWADRRFTKRLREAGFAAEARHVRQRDGQGGTRATIFLGRKPATPAAPDVRAARPARGTMARAGRGGRR